MRINTSNKWGTKGNIIATFCDTFATPDLTKGEQY